MKFKAFADDKLDFIKMTICLLDTKSRKHCGKRRKCWLSTLSPFPTVFSKAFFFRVVKSRDCVVKGFKKKTIWGKDFFCRSLKAGIA